MVAIPSRWSSRCDVPHFQISVRSIEFPTTALRRNLSEGVEVTKFRHSSTDSGFAAAAAECFALDQEKVARVLFANNRPAGGMNRLLRA
jgi:hypothetical protein